MITKSAFLAGLISAATAGTTLWDGRFNDLTSSADLEKWSFANPVGPYQYYIHGTGPVTSYVNLSPSFKNPADSSSKQGVKITIDATSTWNGSPMLRTELIPQTNAAINKGKTTYHFSIKTSATNAPTTTNEHQIAFFESHFTELKFGGASGNKLEWMVGGVSKWNTELIADEWHNVAYEIDFDAASVAFWYSTGSQPLEKTVQAVKASTQSNGADWHLGVLRLPQGGGEMEAEDWFFGGVYVESGEVTTVVGTGGAGEQPVKSGAAATQVKASSTKPAVVETQTSASVVLETPVVKESLVASSSSALPALETSAPAPAPAPATTLATQAPTTQPQPSPTPASGPNSGANAKLPEEFTIKEFVAWLKARTGKE